MLDGVGWNEVGSIYFRGQVLEWLVVGSTPVGLRLSFMADENVRSM